MLASGGQNRTDIGRTVGRYDVCATGQRLDQGGAQPLPAGGLQQQVRLPHQIGEPFGIGDIACEGDAIGDAERCGLRCQCRAQRPSARDRQPPVEVRQPRQRRQCRCMILLLDQSPDHQQLIRRVGITRLPLHSHLVHDRGHGRPGQQAHRPAPAQQCAIMLAHNDGQVADPADCAKSSPPRPGGKVASAGRADGVGNARDRSGRGPQTRQRDQHVALVAGGIEDVRPVPPHHRGERGELGDHRQASVAAWSRHPPHRHAGIDKMRADAVGMRHP